MNIQGGWRVDNNQPNKICNAANITFTPIRYVDVKHTRLFTKGVLLNFFLPQPIIHIATIPDIIFWK
jgi:hypothetical protein